MTRSARALGIAAVLFGSVAGLTFVGGAADRRVDGVAPVTIPFDLLPTRHIVIRLRVNGKREYPVIFDTGSPLVMLATKVGRECGLLRAPADPDQSGVRPTNRVVLRSVAVGATETEAVPALLIDHPLLKQFAGRPAAPEGVIGFPFFARYRCTIDYRAKTLSLTPNGYQPPDVLDEMARFLTNPPPPPVLAPAGQWGIVVRKEADDRAPGVILEAVRPGSAGAAVLRPGDRLLSIDGRWTDGVVDCYDAARFAAPGRPARVEIRRGTVEMVVTVTPRPGL